MLSMYFILLDLIQNGVFEDHGFLFFTSSGDLDVFGLWTEMCGVVFSLLSEDLLLHHILVNELLVKDFPHLTLLFFLLFLFEFTGPFKLGLGI